MTTVSASPITRNCPASAPFALALGRLALALIVLAGWTALPSNAQEAATTNVRLKKSGNREYRLEPALSGAGLQASGQAPASWVKAWPANGGSFVHFGSRLVLELEHPADPQRFIEGRPLRWVRAVTDRIHLLQAKDAWSAAEQASALGAMEGVLACAPVTRKQAQLQGPYAPRPRDPMFFRPERPSSEWQPYLENRDTNGTPLGVDLNVRAAWAITRGQGVTLAIADDGFDLDHLDLQARAKGAPHWNFHTQSTDAAPFGWAADHGTAVAGLAGATADNRIGIAGVAPQVRLASWVLFDSDVGLPDDEVLMDMFQYSSNRVGVQNHSWGNIALDQLGLTTLEDIGISNTVTFGREGRGVVIVRAAGNGREQGSNANDDGYAADPRVIAVAAVRLDGRAARYSNPGACVLVAAPSGDAGDETEENPCETNSPSLLTTDRTGADGYNAVVSAQDTADYAFGSAGFSGTSASTPQISGGVALILSANPKLSYRDVQQILAQASRHYGKADPDLRTNGAGLAVSHNLGYGVPDAGLAVALARRWPLRPSLQTVTLTKAAATEISDLSLRLAVSGPNVPEWLRSIPALAGSGAYLEASTEPFPLRSLGSASTPAEPQAGRHAALILRGGNYFCEKIIHAAAGGASLAVIYNHRDRDRRVVMAGTDFSPIPSLMLSQTDGEALLAYANREPRARVAITSTPLRVGFNVTNTLVCEHVALRVQTDHTHRGDLRISLISPSGTRSLLQHVNGDSSDGPIDWTYTSTHHFCESSVGTWTAEIADEDANGKGRVLQLDLILRGVAITDRDGDGLDDAWEKKYFGDLNPRLLDDPDGDGFNHAREQIAGMDPTRADNPLAMNLSVWDGRLLRLSWPSTERHAYRVHSGMDTVKAAKPLTAIPIPGRFPETEIFLRFDQVTTGFFRIETVPLEP